MGLLAMTVKLMENIAMANLFNAAEVIDMGITKEKRRRDFYGKVAEAFKEKDLKELFGRLRDWEDEHVRKFTDIRKSVMEEETEDRYPGELNDYMNALVDDLLYKQVSAAGFAKNVKSPIDAIRYGMGFERDAILFFNELLKYMTSANQERILELIKEEKKHLMYLAEMKKRYE
jgi:rubrerythrin